jgi:hypothetical protein
MILCEYVIMAVLSGSLSVSDENRKLGVPALTLVMAVALALLALYVGSFFVILKMEIKLPFYAQLFYDPLTWLLHRFR